MKVKNNISEICRLWIYYADMVKLADTLDLGSNAKSVQVQVLSSVPTVRCKLLHRIFRFTKSQLCCAVGGLVRCARFSQMLRADSPSACGHPYQSIKNEPHWFVFLLSWQE